MDKKWKAKIINALRKLSFSYPPRNEAKKKRKVAPAIYSCAICEVHCYDGKSEKAYEKHKETYPDLVYGIVLDHIEPVVDLKKGFGNWNEFMEGLFCDEENFQAICNQCHDIKTKKENEERVLSRRKK